MPHHENSFDSWLSGAGKSLSGWLRGDGKHKQKHTNTHQRPVPRRPKYSTNIKPTIKYLNKEADPSIGECRVFKVGFLGYDTSDPASFSDLNGNQDFSDTESDYSITGDETESTRSAPSHMASISSGYDSKDFRVNATDSEDDDFWNPGQGPFQLSSTTSNGKCRRGQNFMSNSTGKNFKDLIYDAKMLNRFEGKWVELLDFRNLRIAQISGGGYHACALTDDGRVFSMGWNRFGQLGTGDNRNRFSLSPVKWDFDPVPKISQVKCSGRHTLLLANDGRLFTMGCGENGRLGIGGTKSHNTPQLVHTLEGSRVKLLATTFWHNIVSTEDNRTYMFGHGEEGKLGLGTTEDVDKPMELVELRGREIVSASGGAWHTIIATKDGHVYTAGSNYWGQLGTTLKRQRDENTRDHSSRLIEVEALRGIPVIKASAGSNFNLILTATNEIYTFGCGSSGKCGLGNKETIKTPHKIAFDHPIKDICNGSNHSIILTKNGHLYTFGWNKYYQLGSGTEDEVFVPTRVQGLDGVEITSISSGAFYTLCSTRNIPSQDNMLFSPNTPFRKYFSDLEIVMSG